MPRIVLIAGFEAFNTQPYQRAAALAHKRCPELDIQVFCELPNQCSCDRTHRLSYYR